MRDGRADGDNESFRSSLRTRLFADMLSRLLNLLFPSKCPVCGSPSNDLIHNPICNICWTSIKRYEGPRCSICGLPTPSQYTGICGECLDNKPSYSRIMYYGIYEGALRESIHFLKFGGVKRLAGPLSKLLIDLSPGRCDAIVPVPLHPDKLREREFNQTALLSRHLSNTLGIPLLLHSLTKTRRTKLKTEVSGRKGTPT